MRLIGRPRAVRLLIGGEQFRGGFKIGGSGLAEALGERKRRSELDAREGLVYASRQMPIPFGRLFQDLENRVERGTNVVPLRAGREQRASRITADRARLTGLPLRHFFRQVADTTRDGVCRRLAGRLGLLRLRQRHHRQDQKNERHDDCCAHGNILAGSAGNQPPSYQMPALPCTEAMSFAGS